MQTLRNGSASCHDAPLLPAHRLVVSILAAAAFSPVQAQTDTESVMLASVSDTLIVVGEQPSLWSPGESIDSQRTISAEELAMFAAPGAGSPYSAVSALPGVQAETLDPFGFGNLMGGNKGLRIRGVNATHGANGTIEGTPVTGMGPGPGYLWLFDQENIRQVQLTQGPVKADDTDLYNTIGALNTDLLWPSAGPSGRLSASLGIDDMNRFYARGDTGELSTGGRAMASASRSQADQWTGPGKAADNRNLAIALERNFGALKASLWYSQSKGEQHSYRALSYAQSKDLDSWYDYSYSADPGDLANYYDHNRQQFNSNLWLAKLRYQISASSYIEVQPYHSHEGGDYWSGTTTGLIRDWAIDHEATGIKTQWVNEWDSEQGNSRLTIGHWYMTMEPPGPPTAWKMYKPQDNGSLVFTKWMVLAKVVEEHQFNSAWAQFDQQGERLDWSAGLRYLRETLPSLDFYNTDGLGDVSYSTALKQSSGVVAARSAEGFDLDAWLPFAGLKYRWNDRLSSRLAVGRSMGAPAFSSWPQFQSNYASFNAAGVTSQDVMDQQKIETQDGIDIGLTWQDADRYADLTLYYAQFRNKGITYYDPDVGVAYSQNVGDGHQQGLQFAGGWQLLEDWQLFANLAWTKAVLDDDVLAAGGSTLEVEGKQLPDVPLWSGAIGSRWQYEQWSVAPLLRYTGQRYADSAHQESVAGYARLDMTAGYSAAMGTGVMSVKLSGVNLTNKRYIGRINAGDVQSSGALTYYAGAPRSWLATVGYEW
ncbi:TonB-dependent receptor [Oceanobacter mangrovi]|uniref:TonB-dependent receptor n=1 Tax=Oceanobacter mangrovi TaxID=2862510 RepID=UPI001C8EEDF0|nr:TonB-dependent receptor [Oceanobacter mangrovi]